MTGPVFTHQRSMRLSARDFSWIVLAWAIAFFLAPWIPFDRPFVHHRHQVAMAELRIIEDQIAHSFLSDANDAFDEEAFWRDLGFSSDPWGNRYHLAGGGKPTGVARPHPFGAYCLGQDGKSNSQGNDPDDLNTWFDRVPEFYKQRGRTYDRSGDAWRSIYLVPFTLAGVGWVRRMIHELKA